MRSCSSDAKTTGSPTEITLAASFLSFAPMSMQRSSSFGLALVSLGGSRWMAGIPITPGTASPLRVSTRTRVPASTAGSTPPIFPNQSAPESSMRRTISPISSAWPATRTEISSEPGRTAAWLP